MADGDKLHSLMYPNSVEAQLRKVTRELRDLKTRVATQGARHSGSGGGGEAPGTPGQPVRLPVPNAEDVTVAVSDEFTKEGLHRQTVELTLPDTYEATRGFMGYTARLTGPDGEAHEVSCSTVETASGIVADRLLMRSLPAPARAVSAAAWTAEVRVRSYYGDGPWSPKIAFTIGPDTSIPTSPAIPFVGAKSSGITVDWAAVADADYAYTEVWRGTGDFTISSGELQGTTTGIHFDLVWDPQADYIDGGYDTIKIRHIDKSGNASPLSPGRLISSGTNDGTKVNEGQLASTINYSGTFNAVYGGILQTGTGGVIQTGDGRVKLTETELKVTGAVSGTPDQIPFYDLTNVQVGQLGVAGEDIQFGMVGAGQALRIAGNTLLRLFGNTLVFAGPVIPETNGTPALLIHEDTASTPNSAFIQATTGGGSTVQFEVANDGRIGTGGSTVATAGAYIRTAATNVRGLVVNALSGVTANLLELAVNGTTKLSVDATGALSAASSTLSGPLTSRQVVVNPTVANTELVQINAMAFQSTNLINALVNAVSKWRVDQSGNTTQAGGVTATTGTFSGALSAASSTLSGILSAASLSVNGKALTVGTSFPGSPNSGDRCLRTDLTPPRMCTYDGSRWLGERLSIMIPFATNSGGNASTYTGTTLVSRFVPPTPEKYYITSIAWWVRVDTTNNLFNDWTLRLGHESNGFGGSADLDLNTATLTAGTASVVSGTPNVSLDFSSTSNYDLFLEVRKDVGSPGTLNVWGVQVTFHRQYN